MAETRTDLLAREQKRRRLVAGLAVVALLALVAGVVVAQSSPSFDLSWYSLDSGSSVSVGGPFGMAGTLGESLTGRAGSPTFGMGSGYDPGVPDRAPYRIYLPIVFRIHS